MSLGRSSAGKVQWVTATGFSKQGTDCQEENFGKGSFGNCLAQLFHSAQLYDAAQALPARIPQIGDQ